MDRLAELKYELQDIKDKLEEALEDLAEARRELKEARDAEDDEEEALAWEYAKECHERVQELVVKLSFKKTDIARLGAK